MATASSRITTTTEHRNDTSRFTTTQTQQLLTPDINTMDWQQQFHSAPQSRSGSFKKTRRTNITTDASSRSSLPSLEDSIAAKLLELQQLEADDCRVVLEFVTSERGIVNRGDSFRRNRGDVDAPHIRKKTSATTGRSINSA